MKKIKILLNSVFQLRKHEIKLFLFGDYEKVFIYLYRIVVSEEKTGLYDGGLGK